MAEGRSVVLGRLVIAEKFRLAPLRGASVAEGRSVVLGRLVIAEKFRLLLHKEAPVWRRADLLFWVGSS